MVTCVNPSSESHWPVKESLSEGTSFLHELNSKVKNINKDISITFFIA
jgi:hypothetical protein